MDLNDLRSFITVLSFATFIGIMWWTFSGKRKASFDEAGLLPFTDDEPVDEAWLASRKNERKAP